ncbi:MAG: hypothetical protein ACK4KV_08630 [Rhodocyclaceae bacterium]
MIGHNAWRHARADRAILAARHQTYLVAREGNAARYDLVREHEFPEGLSHRRVMRSPTSCHPNAASLLFEAHGLSRHLRMCRQ